jgi:hypothetical protein
MNPEIGSAAVENFKQISKNCEVWHCQEAKGAWPLPTRPAAKIARGKGRKIEPGIFGVGKAKLQGFERTPYHVQPVTQIDGTNWRYR